MEVSLNVLGVVCSLSFRMYFVARRCSFIEGRYIINVVARWENSKLIEIELELDTKLAFNCDCCQRRTFYVTFSAFDRPQRGCIDDVYNTPVHVFSHTYTKIFEGIIQ